MAGVSVGRRKFHAFLSHAHADKKRADDLYEWLRDIAAVPVWYDAVNMPPGATIAQMLPDAIENSRSMILLLSKESVSRGWVQHEYHAAINHQTQHRPFRIIPVRLDDVSPPGFLQNYSAITLPESGLDAAAASAILRGLYQPATSIDPHNGRNIYVGRGWRRDDTPLAEQLCAALNGAGFQLIGDSQDQLSWVEDRVLDLIEGCGGFAAALPYRPTSAHKTSKYILREWELAASRDLPCLVVADPRTELPPEIIRRPGLTPSGDSGDSSDASLTAAAASLAEEWRTPIRSPYAFYIADFAAETAPLRQAIRELIESVTAFPCLLGEYVKGDVIQRAIFQAVSRATFALADISGDGANVYIEIGAARAMNVPLFLLRQGPPGRPAFMLRDQHVWDYTGDHDLLGRVLRIAYPYRRSLLSPGYL
jgi:hypothetical protein